MSESHTHYRTCNLCEAMCGLEIKVDGQHILSIKGDKDDPFSRGHICPKATALEDIYHDPDRLKYPVRRTATGWERISWDEAFDEVVGNIQRIQGAHGRNAIGVYLGNPNVHNLGLILYNAPFIRSLKTKNRFSATSVDQLPSQYAAYLMFGHQLLFPVPDVDRTHYFLMLGANPLASNGSLMTAAGIENRLKALQKRGGKLVVIDPRRTETAVLANEHHFIRPGTDALFLLALIHTLVVEGLVKPGRLAEFTDGLETVEQLAADFTPEDVAGYTGIAAEEMRRMARELAAAESGVVYGRIGVSTQKFGGLCQWLINVLNVLTGNLDAPGGAMFTRPAVDVVGLTTLTGQTGSVGRAHSRVRGLPAVGGEFPAAAMAEEILTPGEGQIRGMITVAGNPVLSTPNGGQLDEALAQLDFMVAIDIYINETTRHANIILPTTTGLETEHYDLVFHLLAVRNTAKYSPALFEPEEGMLHDWQVLGELRRRLEGGGPINRKTLPGKIEFQKRLPPHKLIDLALRFGPYGARPLNGKPTGHNLTLAKLKRAPHGIDLGPLEPILRERLLTPNRRIVLAPEPLVADVARLKETYPTRSGRSVTEPGVARSEDRPHSERELVLIGRRDLRTNNSWMHNAPRLVKGKERCTLLMHPADAAARQLAPGQVVAVVSRVGQVRLPLEVTEAVMPGVVSMPHGWGHGREAIQLSVAQAHPGVSINDLTDECELDVLTGNAAFSGTAVVVTPC
ncbi:MAG: molybdopterin oxidoreductase family protein [Anaerolineae bacterium]|nr:molybdopterin oxidoreductase family protein [Anaerolineae bacterium]